MSRRQYVPRTMWNDTETLLETAVESAQQLQSYGMTLWSNAAELLGFEGSTEKKDPVLFEAQVILVLRGSISADSHRSRLMEMELVEAFTPLKATANSKEVQLWTDYRDQDLLALDQYFGVKYFDPQSESKEETSEEHSDSREQRDADEVERETHESEFDSNGVRIKTKANLIICADPKKCQFAVPKKQGHTSKMFEKGLTRLSVAASSNKCAGIADVQDLLQNMMSANVPVMVLIGLDLERAEANELINISRHQLWLMVVRALGIIPSSTSAFPVSRAKKFGHDFWFENGIAAAQDNKIRFEAELLFKD